MAEKPQRTYSGLLTNLEETHEKLKPFLVDSGEVVVPMDAYIVTAQKEG